MNSIKRAIYKIYEKRLLTDVKKREMPKHVAIIMDGNRRYAKKLGLDPSEGHELGSKKTEEVLDWCDELGIKMITLYTFSTENLRKRDEREKQRIFQILERELKRLLNDRKTYEKELGVKLVGKREFLPESILRIAEKVEEATKNHKRRFLNIAVAYGGRQEIVDATIKIAEDAKSGKIKISDINEALVEKYLYEAGLYSKVDIVIRTGGEQRLSNFLTWQAASSFAYFCDVNWPEFRKIDLLRAIRAWQGRVCQES